MKKTLMIAFAALALTSFTACGNESNRTTEALEAEEGTDTGITPTEADTSITLDPDTTTEHEMAL